MYVLFVLTASILLVYGVSFPNEGTYSPDFLLRILKNYMLKKSSSRGWLAHSENIERERTEKFYGTTVLTTYFFGNCGSRSFLSKLVC